MRRRKIAVAVVSLAGILVGALVYLGYHYQRRAEASRYAEILIADLDAQIHELESGHVHGPGCNHGPPPGGSDLDPHKPFLEHYARYATPEDIDAVLLRLEKLKHLLDEKHGAMSR